MDTRTLLYAQGPLCNPSWVYYRQTSQSQGSRRTREKDVVDRCAIILRRVVSNPGCRQGELEDLRIFRAMCRAQQSLLPTGTVSLQPWAESHSACTGPACKCARIIKQFLKQSVQVLCYQETLLQPFSLFTLNNSVYCLYQ